ncbi:inositol monophosphatase family protein [Franzmannia qiaohouensis]|uniref:Inositol-1-monophosphatase n=1 Tax=Franzmannia qiaohouensis TaxID=1329370 RepID=A0ABU1H9N3_9GAMM|nr:MULTISPECIES: inositol monophosphatase family protein [Halomonas]MDR5904156.1 inositol monophosphatase family protein [Halomonas qiaohouensis]
MIDKLETLSDTLQRAARAAGDILREGYHAAGTIEFDRKGASDFVSHYDRAAEQAIIDTIRLAHPEVGFLGEESGITPAGDSDLRVVIDPLDGTNNFLHKVPHFSVSIALERGEELLMGVVYQPLLDEMLWAVHGRGAFLGDQRLRLPPARPLNEMLVGTCLPYHGKGECQLSCRQLAHIMPQVSGIRSPGSAALEVAYVALGRFDAFWSQGAKLEWWDIAAGIIIAREAGCKVTDLSGNSTPREWHSLLVAHPDRHGPLAECLTH